MTSSLFESKEPARSMGSSSSFREDIAAAHVQHEAAIYVEVGEFFFRNPGEMSSQMLVAWFTDVAHSEPERRWGTLEMLALYGLSAGEATGGFPLTGQQKADLIASVTVDGPLKMEYEQAAIDAISLLQSKTDPTAELPESWLVYRQVVPEAFITACLVFAVLTLESVRAVAVQDKVDPAVMWRNWLTSTPGK